MLCPDCKRWIDKEDRHLLGWEALEGPGVFWPLPRGHRPPDYTVDAATGWSPVYGGCVPDRDANLEPRHRDMLAAWRSLQ